MIWRFFCFFEAVLKVFLVKCAYYILFCWLKWFLNESSARYFSCSHLYLKWAKLGAFFVVFLKWTGCAAETEQTVSGSSSPFGALIGSRDALTAATTAEVAICDGCRTAGWGGSWRPVLQQSFNHFTIAWRHSRRSTMTRLLSFKGNLTPFLTDLVGTVAFVVLEVITGLLKCQRRPRMGHKFGLFQNWYLVCSHRSGTKVVWEKPGFRRRCSSFVWLMPPRQPAV